MIPFARPDNFVSLKCYIKVLQLQIFDYPYRQFTFVLILSLLSCKVTFIKGQQIVLQRFVFYETHSRYIVRSHRGRWHRASDSFRQVLLYIVKVMATERPFPCSWNTFIPLLVKSVNLKQPVLQSLAGKKIFTSSIMSILTNSTFQYSKATFQNPKCALNIFWID